MSRKRWLAAATLLLALTFVFFETSGLDLSLQDRFYSSERHAWLVPKSAKLPRALFYHGPKVLLIAFGAWLFFSLAVPRGWRVRRFLSRQPPRHLIYLAVCLGLFPALIGGLKRVSGIHCPSELVRYGGEHHYRKVFSPPDEDARERGHCFPAGHASGGFALLGLWFVARTSRGRLAALALGITAGWAMGLYQMLSGSHFLSHTVVTMILAWIYTLALAMLFGIPRPPLPDRS